MNYICYFFSRAASLEYFEHTLKKEHVCWKATTYRNSSLGFTHNSVTCCSPTIYNAYQIRQLFSLPLSQQRGSANFDLILPKMPALLLYLHCKITPLWLAQGNKMMKISIHLHCTGPKNGWKQLLMWLLKITGDTENWWVTYVNILSNLLIVLQKRCQIR